MAGLLKSIVGGVVIATVHAATHFAFGDVSTFGEAGVYAAGIAVFLSSVIVIYVLD